MVNSILLGIFKATGIHPKVTTGFVAGLVTTYVYPMLAAHGIVVPPVIAPYLPPLIGAVCAWFAPAVVKEGT